MKLATAFVEIAVRTDEFRRQLDEARGLAGDAADAIGRVLAPPPREPADRADEDRAPDDESAPAPLEQQRPQSLDMLAPGGWRGPSELRSPPVIVPSAPAVVDLRSNGESSYPGPSADETALLREQVELHRRSLEVLRRQLDVLEEFRRGLPAVLT